MASSGRNPSIDVLRDAVRRAQQDGVSLAALGAAIGLSAAGVLKFLRGSDPRPSTVKKLHTWYSSRPPLEDGPQLATVQPTFDGFLPGLPDDDRAELLRVFRDHAATLYQKRGTAPARWITQLAE
ncbi:hypothetical protein [Longimicrobium sp.]|uniref:hypothetical protein n=1 Tax=Longimicrobium sp. TaxID=2029185 RepID=UPI002B7CB61C|nr:hypothetical protein [Longimicrobium sp.]HSU16073.1 hypothetical protein [Longimicrobium sp.]